MNNNMEQLTPNGAENNNASPEGIMDIVGQLRKLEDELKALKATQEKLREMPERAEKNSLLGDIENKIRETVAAKSELQDKKMELMQKGDKKYTLGGEALSVNENIPVGSTVEQDPFKDDPQSLGSWRQLNK